MGTSTESLGGIIGDIRAYRNIGLDSEGRSHHYDPDRNEIVVAASDCRRGITTDDIIERITPPAWSTSEWDYIHFVREETDLEWVEIDAPLPPEGSDA